jgi:acetyl-CoA acetyltransferase family protein
LKNDARGKNAAATGNVPPAAASSRINGEMMKEIVIVDGARTPMAEYNGQFSDISAIDLGVIAAKEALSRSGFAPDEVQHVIVGNALQTSGDAIYGARHVGLKAGVPKHVPALTVNRLCGSGIQSVVGAAEQIMLDEATAVLAGGMENMSQAPHVIRGARKGFKLGQGAIEDSLMVALLDTYCGLYMAQTAENLARKYEISREAQDEFALRSQQRAGAAIDKLKEEIVPVTVGRKGEQFAEDDHMRPDTTIEGLAKLRPAFAKDGFVTAGNASGIVDGAAMVVVTTADQAKAKGKTPLGRIVSWGITGCDPDVMGIGPVPATQIALKRAGLQIGDLDLIEVNEAFAAQTRAVAKELGIDPDKLNVNGGAIALGHPLGASGTRLLITLLYELRRRKGRYGLASACIGGGQGISMIVESYH